MQLRPESHVTHRIGRSDCRGFAGAAQPVCISGPWTPASLFCASFIHSVAWLTGAAQPVCISGLWAPAIPPAYSVPHSRGLPELHSLCLSLSSCNSSCLFRASFRSMACRSCTACVYIWTLGSCNTSRLFGASLSLLIGCPDVCHVAPVPQTQIQILNQPLPARQKSLSQFLTMPHTWTYL